MKLNNDWIMKLKKCKGSSPFQVLAQHLLGKSKSQRWKLLLGQRVLQLRSELDTL
jgi:hypothetical protein